MDPSAEFRKEIPSRNLREKRSVLASAMLQCGELRNWAEPRGRVSKSRAGKTQGEKLLSSSSLCLFRFALFSMEPRRTLPDLEHVSLALPQRTLS